MLQLGCAFLCFLLGGGDLDFSLFFEEFDFEFCFFDLLRFVLQELRFCRRYEIFLLLDLGFDLRFLGTVFV